MNVADFICPPLQWPSLSPYTLAVSNESNSSRKADNEVHEHIESLSSNKNQYLEPIFIKSSMRCGWENMGITFLEKDKFDEEQHEILVGNLIDILVSTPSIHSTVSAFAKYLHPIESSGAGYDISLSDPDLPFSIFSTLPKLNENNCFYRFTESVVHESLHLQLTAIEMNSALFDYENLSSSFYSPWKGEGRSEQGLLHAIYVFSNIKTMWEVVHRNTPCVYLESRIATIRKQLSDARHILDSKALTFKGRELVHYLL